MNILPKKSWHVRNKDNVAKVKKDEENARIQSKERSRRAEAADQEAKIDYLRQKARDRIIKSTTDLKDVLDYGVGPSKSSVSATMSSYAKNEENERDKKDEKMNYEKKIGLLKYLGQDAAETMEDKDKPWYFRAPKRHKEGDGSDDSADEIDTKRKSSMDPINSIRIHVREKKASDQRKADKVKKSKSKKHKKYVEDEREVRLDTKQDKLAKLRKERIAREKKEKERTRILMNGVEKSTTETAPQRYNSQYNPHLARNRYGR